MCFFLHLSTWRRQPHWSPSNKKLSSRQPTTATDKTELGKLWKILSWIINLSDTKGIKKKQHTKISIPKEFEEVTTNSQVDLPAGGKRWRLHEGEAEVKRQEKSRLWAPLVPSFPVLVRREAGQPARLLNFTLSNGRVGPVEEREVSHLVSLFLRGHTAGLDPEGRWLERQIYFSFFCFSCFRF